MSASPSLADDYRALREGVGAVWLPRDVLRVTGPDAVSFLQGQLSQDVAALGAGVSAWSLLLQPQGKVDALVRVTRVGDEEVLVDVDGGWGDAVSSRLQRFKLRVRADIEALAWECLAVRGPASSAVGPQGDDVRRLAADWPGLPGFDLVGAGVPVPDGIRVCGLDAYEAARVEAGVPHMGAELTEQTIPAEAGVVERTVSFTKGCFTGQELVARIDSRGGNVPRRLRGLVLADDPVPPTGAEVLDAAGTVVGALTSVAWSPGRAAPVALAYVRRAVEPPADATVRWGEAGCGARIEALPLVS